MNHEPLMPVEGSEAGWAPGGGGGGGEKGIQKFFGSFPLDLNNKRRVLQLRPLIPFRYE